jgi:hypothetical protein
MAYSATPSPGPVKAFQGREEVLPGGAGSSEETAGRADFEAHVETYRGFLLFMAIAAAHVLVILLLLYWFLM